MFKKITSLIRTPSGAETVWISEGALDITVVSLRIVLSLCR